MRAALQAAADKQLADAQQQVLRRSKLFSHAKHNRRTGVYDFPDYRAAVRDGNASRVLFLEYVERPENTSVRKSCVQNFRPQKFKFSLL